MDFGPSRHTKLKNDKLHLWDYESDKGSHILSINPNQVVDLKILDEIFDPNSFVTWNIKKSPWFIEREWEVNLDKVLS